MANLDLFGFKQMLNFGNFGNSDFGDLSFRDNFCGKNESYPSPPVWPGGLLLVDVSLVFAGDPPSGGFPWKPKRGPKKGTETTDPQLAAAMEPTVGSSERLDFPSRGVFLSGMYGFAVCLAPNPTMRGVHWLLCAIPGGAFSRIWAINRPILVCL